MPTRRPVATKAAHGQFTLRVSPRLELSHDQVATALAVISGKPRPSHGPTTIPTVVSQWVTLMLTGQAPPVPPESTVQAWREQLVTWGVWPQ